MSKRKGEGNECTGYGEQVYGELDAGNAVKYIGIFWINGRKTKTMAEIAKIRLKLWIKLWVNFAFIFLFVYVPGWFGCENSLNMGALEKSSAKHETVQQLDGSKQFAQTACALKPSDFWYYNWRL